MILPFIVNRKTVRLDSRYIYGGERGISSLRPLLLRAPRSNHLFESRVRIAGHLSPVWHQLHANIQ
jgi:hypothetical protein